MPHSIARNRRYHRGFHSRPPRHARSTVASRCRVARSTQVAIVNAAAKTRRGGGLSARFLHFTLPYRVTAYAGLVLLIIAAAGEVHFQLSQLQGSVSPAAQIQSAAVPNHSLTPGATRPATIADVCAVPHEEVIRTVPTTLRQEVFQEYGIPHARSEDYEIDFLIAPLLGGAEDIRNLWPEPYMLPLWNAPVKDALEEHLHQLVCAGKLDLPTAQRDIASNWIAAYKKYFHVNEPASALSNRIRSVEARDGAGDLVIMSVVQELPRTESLVVVLFSTASALWN